MLSGIIDFANARVKGEPQFTHEELDLLVKCAKDYGLKTFAHCSGVDGLELAVNSGIDSIEHGFFMNEKILEQMGTKNIAWVPTFVPVEFQAREPQHAGWDENTVKKLREILDNHSNMLKYALRNGVRVMAGSDGGSFGVRHGHGLHEELQLMHNTGMSEEEVLASACSVPQKHFGLKGGFIRPGYRANFISFNPLSSG